ncbi:MAG: hypothetical protein ACI4TK_03070 [Agathobacter sp.]
MNGKVKKILAVCVICIGALILLALLITQIRYLDVNILRGILAGTKLILWNRIFVIWTSANVIFWGFFLLLNKRIDTKKFVIKMIFLGYGICWIVLLVIWMSQWTENMEIRKYKKVSTEDLAAIKELTNVYDFGEYGTITESPYN